jgi:hypothetical protein
MIAAISLTDFDHHRENYRNLRLGIFNHQPSGVKGNEYDLNLFSNYFHEHHIQAITGEEILNSLVSDLPPDIRTQFAHNYLN